ncbi:MAG: HAD hydrolase-like protein [Actinomycetales bacterium]|nr:HAD hydrolase-like protein [Actinomycetales bacterium]
MVTEAVPAYDVVLIDLDGTIIDSEPGIHTALRYALVEGFGIVPTAAELQEFMGPPLSDILPRVYGMSDPSDHARFFELYCEKYFHDTEYEFDVYPGVSELIADLHAHGVDVVLATAKPQESAERILDKAGLRPLFEFVAGSASDGSRQEKADVIAHAFEHINADGSTHRIVMVGDRELDAQAAQAHEVDSILVEWGYAPEGELAAAGATHVVRDVGALRALLLPS